MSQTYLDSLAALATGQGTRLVPRTPGRFEPLEVDGAAVEWSEEVLEREVTEVRVPPPSPRLAPVPPAVDTPAAEPPVGHDDDPVSAVDRPQATRPPAVQREPVPPPREDVVRDEVAPAERVAPRVFVTFESSRQPAPARQSVVVEKPVEVAVPERVVERVEVPRPVVRRAVDPMTVVPLTRAEAVPRRDLESARTVSVHIGRVDVRAVLAPTPTPAPVVEPTAPAGPDLEDYLRGVPR